MRSICDLDSGNVTILTTARHWCLALLVFVIAVAGRLSNSVHAENNSPPVDFVGQIKPILATHCYRCHGPQRQEGGLRWDRKRSAMSGVDSGDLAIVAGNPDESQLLVRIGSEDEDLRMPPAADGKTLGTEQVALLRRWVLEGAVWPDDEDTHQHWAYAAPRNARLPTVHDTSWPESVIDSFVLARLEQQQMQPAPRAERSRRQHAGLGPG